MEKQMKKLSKKAVMIGSIVLAVVLVVGGVIGLLVHKNTRPTDPDKIYTFDEITMGLSQKVSRVVDIDNEWTEEEIDELYRHCMEIHYHYSDINNTKLLGYLKILIQNLVELINNKLSETDKLEAARRAEEAIRAAEEEAMLWDDYLWDDIP